MKRLNENNMKHSLLISIDVKTLYINLDYKIRSITSFYFIQFIINHQEVN